MVTIPQMNAWNKVSSMAAKRKLERRRMESVAKILAVQKAKKS